MTTPTPESFERYNDPTAEAVRAVLLETEKRAVDAAIVFLVTRGDMGSRLDAAYEQDAAVIMVDALRDAMARYIATGVEPIHRVRRASARQGHTHARASAFQAVQSRWCIETSNALERRLLAARGGS